MLADAERLRVGEDEETATFRYDLSSSSDHFERLFAASAGWMYRFKDRSTIYRFTNSPNFSGIGRACY